MVLPGHDVVLFSPQKRTDDSPMLAISRLPLAWLPNVNPGIRSVTRIMATRGPGTSSVTNEPIWLMTVTWPWAVATGLTRKPTKWRSEADGRGYVDGDGDVDELLGFDGGCGGCELDAALPLGVGVGAHAHLAIVQEEDLAW